VPDLGINVAGDSANDQIVGPFHASHSHVPVSPFVPPEPWYYARLVTAAQIWILITYVLLGVSLLVVFVFLVGILLGSLGSRSALGLFGLIPIAMAVVTCLVVTLFSQVGALLILLGVDAARNLRYLRFVASATPIERN
jgi:hypothetical protein